MSQRDLTAELRAAHTTVPPELRERIRLIATADPAPRRPRFTLPTVSWRRALGVAVPLAAAVAATVVLTRPSHNRPTAVPADRATTTHGSIFRAPVPQAKAKSFGAATAGGAARVATSQKRLQDYEATLTLREADQRALSRASQHAQQIVASLSGFAQSVSVSKGTAHLLLKVPRVHVQAALARLGKLGTIVGESVHVTDLQAGANATDRTIARLQRQLRALRAQTQTPRLEREIAAVTAHVQRLQRQQAATERTAHYATVDLRLATKKEAAAPVGHGHGPLHGLVVAFRWTGIGLVYGLAFGVPLALLWLLALWMRRRREDALISRA
jgi:hypothetical protein